MYKLFGKRIFDIFFSLACLIILSPILLIISILVAFFLGVPIIFRQERAGLHGHVFFIYKYRTMTNKKDDNGNLLPDHERLTFFGKLMRNLSIDELPELYCILKGDMSLVGPRPLLMEYLPHYTTEQARRHEVKPGLTGLAQIGGRNSIDWEDKFKLDVAYVDTYSFWLDLKIIFLTIFKVLGCHGINQSKQITMSKFTGVKFHE